MDDFISFCQVWIYWLLTPPACVVCWYWERTTGWVSWSLSSLVDPSCQTSGPHEALQNQEARQQSLRRLHVRQVCAWQVRQPLTRDGSDAVEDLSSPDALCLPGSSVRSWLRSRRLWSRCWRHRHRARNRSEIFVCIDKIKRQIHFVSSYFLVGFNLRFLLLFTWILLENIRTAGLDL